MILNTDWVATHSYALSLALVYDFAMSVQIELRSLYFTSCLMKRLIWYNAHPLDIQLTLELNMCSHTFAPTQNVQCCTCGPSRFGYTRELCEGYLTLTLTKPSMIYFLFYFDYFAPFSGKLFPKV